MKKIAAFALTLLTLPVSAVAWASGASDDEEGVCFRCLPYEDSHQGEIYHYDFHIGVKGVKSEGGTMHFGPEGVYGDCDYHNHRPYDKGKGGGGEEV